MAVDTYTNLQAEIADWLNRQDLTAQIPTFIRLLEAQVERELRVRQMIVRSTATLDAQFTELPVDFLSMVNVQLNTDPASAPLLYAPMDEIDRIRAAHSAGGQPTAYTIVGSTIEVAPVPDDEYEIEIVYYAKLDRLSASVASNWLLEAHPDLYLFGSLMQAAPYLKNDERTEMWGTAFTNMLDSIRLSDERATKGAGPLRARIRPYGVLR